MATNKQTAQAAATKRSKALELRRAGMSYEDIAEAVGYRNRGSAHRAVSQAMAAVARDADDDLMGLELDRLDRMQRGLWPAAAKGDPKAVAAVLSIQTQRTKLLGLDDKTSKAIDETLGEAGCKAVLAVIARTVEDDDLSLSDDQKQNIQAIAMRHIQSVASGRRK